MKNELKICGGPCIEGSGPWKGPRGGLLTGSQCFQLSPTACGLSALGDFQNGFV